MKATWKLGLSGLALAAVAALPVGLVTLDSRRDDARRDDIVRYEKAVLPIVTEWGRIEVQGMRPAIGDLQSGEGVPAEVVAGEAEAWQSALRDIRTRLAARRPPSSLREVGRLFDRALARYIEAAEVFERAAEAAGADREAGIAKGIGLVRQGTRTFNEAGMKLQAARRRAGLPASADFPDHPAA